MPVCVEWNVKDVQRCGVGCRGRENWRGGGAIGEGGGGRGGGGVGKLKIWVSETHWC